MLLQLHFVQCDHLGCSSRIQGDRAVAMRAGWSHRLEVRGTGFAHPVDFCPKHGSDHNDDTIPARAA